MTLPASGTITSTQVIAELGLAAGSSITIPTDVRTLTGIPSGSIVWPTHFYGKDFWKFVARADANAFPNGHQIVIPAAAAVGDLCVLLDVAVNDDGSLPSLVTPSGFTALVSATLTPDDQGHGVSARASYRELTAGQPGSTITGMNGTVERKEMIVVRPSRAIATIVAVDWSLNLVAGNPVSIVVSSGSGTPNLIVFGLAACDTPITTLSFSPAADSVSSSHETLSGYKAYSKIESPANVTVDIADSGPFNALAAGYLRITT